MQKTRFALLLAACLLVTACGKVETPPVTEHTTETSAKATTETTSAPTTEATAQTEPATPPETTGTTADGDAGICSVHAELYHAFPQPWTDFVGKDAYAAWAEAEIAAHKPDETGCPYPTANVYTFIHTFNYPKERFIEEFNTHPWVDYDYQVDLLYEGDPEIIEYYYRNHGHWHTEQTEQAQRLRDMKWKLIDKYPDKLTACENWKEHSLSEMLELVGNDPDDIRTLTEEGTLYGLQLHFDVIAAMDADEREALTAHSAYYQDCVLLGETPYETPYERQVAVNAEEKRLREEHSRDSCAQLCSVHNLEYHAYVTAWIKYVGEDAFMTWNQTEHDTHGPDENGCPYPTTNVYTFIHTFNYPKERFIEDFNTVPDVEYDHPVDLLYGDDPAAVERYYRELLDRHTKMEDDAARLREWEQDLRDQYPEQLKDFAGSKAHSLLERLAAVGTDFSDPKPLNEAAAQYGLQLRFDTIAAMDADELHALLTEHSAFWQDCVLLGETPYETPYEKQVAVNAAAANPEPPAGGAVFPCSVHDLLYHCFPYSWVEKVGEDAFNTWFTEAGNAQAQDAYGCPCPQQNVYAFIHAFRYPKDVFIEQYNTDITIDWCFQVDLLYGDDPAAAEAYYRTAQAEIAALRKKNEALRSLKWELCDRYPDALRDGADWKQHSLLEMMEAAGIDRKVLTDTAAQYNLSLQLDTIAAMDADTLTALRAHSAFYQDCVLLGETPYETPYEKQVADNTAQ